MYTVVFGNVFWDLKKAPYIMTCHRSGGCFGDHGGVVGAFSDFQRLTRPGKHRKKTMETPIYQSLIYPLVI